jgi:hypothetical protein
VNFHVNFNVLLNKYAYSASVGENKDFNNIKMHGTTMKKKFTFCYVVKCIFEYVVLMCLLREG